MKQYLYHQLTALEPTHYIQENSYRIQMSVWPKKLDVAFAFHISVQQKIIKSAWEAFAYTINQKR